MSASTHMPPTGCHWPLATRSRMRWNSDGYFVSIQWYCTACEHTKRYSGYRSIICVALANVRAHLRIGLAQRPQPSRVDVRVTDGDDPVRAGAGRQRRAPAATPGGHAAAVPPTSCMSIALNAASRSRSRRWRRLSVGGSAVISPSSTSTSSSRWKTLSSRSPSAACRSVYSGASPAVASEPRWP